MGIGKTAAKTALKLAENETIVTKTSDILGMLFPYAGLKKRALDMYVSDIENSDLPSESKLIAVLDAKRTVKKLRNQKNIADIAVNNAKEGTDFTGQSKVDEDWLEKFMDAAGFVSSDKLQLTWGKILSQEFETPGSTPPNMIRILSEITPALAQAFKKICSMKTIIVEMNNDGYITKAHHLIIVPYTNNNQRLYKTGLSFSTINELETLGLIKFDPLNGYNVNGISENIESTVLVYSENKTDVITGHEKNKLPVGNIMLTPAGKCLQNITPIEEISGYNEMVKQFMLDKKVKFMSQPCYKVLENEDKIQVIKCNS